MSVDELAACVTDIKSDACAAALAMTDDEFWLADRCVATNSLISPCCDATSCCTRLMHQQALRCARAHMHTHTHTCTKGLTHTHTRTHAHTLPQPDSHMSTHVRRAEPTVTSTLVCTARGTSLTICQRLPWQLRQSPTSLPRWRSQQSTTCVSLSKPQDTVRVATSPIISPFYMCAFLKACTCVGCL